MGPDRELDIAYELECVDNPRRASRAIGSDRAQQAMGPAQEALSAMVGLAPDPSSRAALGASAVIRHGHGHGSS